MWRFLATLAIVLPAVAAAQTPTVMMPPPPESVSVTGTGHASLTPDRFTFTAGVQTIASSVDAAVNENNAKTSAVIAALKRAGATDKDITTSNFTIYPQQDYQQGQLPRILGYQVSNSITVRKANIADAGRLLQAGVSAGVNTSSGLQFEVTDPTKGRDQALRAAVEDARSKATLLAQAAGRTLGRALNISEIGENQPSPPPRPMMMRGAVNAAVSEVPVEAGAQEMTYAVSVVFELR
jgi:uncharacterized protein